jgi:hypothetical protein
MVTAKTIIGVSDGPQKSIEYWENTLNFKFDASLLYQPIEDVSKGINLIKDKIDKYDVSMVITFDGYALNNINDGKLDNYLIDWGKKLNKLKGKSNTLYIRPLHEFNGDWYSYGTYTNGNSIEAFKNAFKRIVRIISSYGGDFVKWQLSYNNIQPHEDNTPFSAYYPGNEYVDMIMVSAYNRCRKGGLEENFNTIFSRAYKKIKEINSGKPIGIAEVATSGECGEKGKWYENMLKTLYSKYNDIKMVNFFLENADMNWSVTNKNDINKFSKALNKYN